MMHPQHFTLNLLKNAIEAAPPVFSETRRQEMLKAQKAFCENLAAPAQEIENTLTAFGQEIWPYREAWQKMQEQYARGREESLIKEQLPPELLNKFLAFLKDGGRLEDFRRGTVLEETFTPEEKFILGQSITEARQRLISETKKLCLEEKSAEFQELLTEQTALRDKMMEKIRLLEGLAGTSPKWGAEMKEKARAFKECFCFLEKNYTMEDINNAIEYYRSAMEETEIN